MAIEYTASEEGDLLIIKARGIDDNVEQVKDYGISVIGECVRRGVKYVLCDERELTYAISTIDTFGAASFIAAHAPRVARVAIVCNPQCLGDALFWEDVAVNRGLTVKIFREPDRARAWLDRLHGLPGRKPEGLTPAP